MMSNWNAVGVALLLLLLLVAIVRVPGWLRPQTPELAVVHQSRRYVPVEDFPRGAESPDLVGLHEYAILAAEVYGVDPDLTGRVQALGWKRCATCEPLEKAAHDGLAFSTWIKTRPDQPALAVIAFRGTVAKEVDDWMSNFRWVTRFIPGRDDQYDQVRHMIPDLLSRIDREVGGPTELVATGHSLGGGLAQQAGYGSVRIARVYGFDPSPVTGYYDLSAEQRKQNSVGKRIYRIYEHGEVLAYVRLLLKAFYPLADRDPEIVEIRFNLTKGNFISQHSMADLARALDQLAQSSRPRPHR
jgi:hypothetical protein